MLEKLFSRVESKRDDLGPVDIHLALMVAEQI